jgi:hypothetical protein
MCSQQVRGVDHLVIKAALSSKAVIAGRQPSRVITTLGEF